MPKQQKSKKSEFDEVVARMLAMPPKQHKKDEANKKSKSKGHKKD